MMLSRAHKSQNPLKKPTRRFFVGISFFPRLTQGELFTMGTIHGTANGSSLSANCGLGFPLEAPLGLGLHSISSLLDSSELPGGTSRKADQVFLKSLAATLIPPRDAWEGHRQRF